MGSNLEATWLSLDSPGSTMSGFTVPDLEAAKGWLIDVLGCEYMYSLGPFESDDDWMAEHLNVDPRAVMRRLHFFRCGGQAIFEVFQYEAPDAADRTRRGTVTSAATTSRCTSRTSTRRSRTCGRPG